MADQEQSGVPGASDQLQQRLARLYRLVGTATETDLGKFPPKIFVSDKWFGIEQDFRGGMNDEQIGDAIYLMLDAIVHLKDHIKNRLAGNSDDAKATKAAVESAVKKSEDLRICRILVNQAKHGIPSGCKPSDALALTGFSRVCRMSAGGEQSQSSVMRQVIRDAVPKMEVTGGGRAEVILSAEVVDGNGESLGDIHRIALRAVDYWYSLLGDFGLELPDEIG